METKMSLCPACTACPEVEVGETAVKIGEECNQVTLKAEEWNVLVDLINSGRLCRL